MRTKHFLTALCLPLAFAACTNDDFVNESNTLEGREMIDVVLTATKPSYGADTKMSIDDKNQFVWEKDVDMIGAALVDGETAGSVGEKIYINYPFTADADGNVSTFSGKSAMTQGLYFFYYEYQDVLNRKGLPMGKPAQVYDAANEKTALQQAATYMRMVSPIVNLKKGLKYADAQTYNLNLKFANLYTIVRVDINSVNIPTGVAPKVTKIKLDGKNGGTSAFNTDAAIQMSVVGNAGQISLDDNGQIKTDEQDAALAELEKKIADGSIYSANQADGATTANKGAFELNVKGDVVLDAAKATSLYILVPKGTYKQLDLTVETSEGSYSRTITPAADIVLANKIQPIAANLNFAQDGSGNVILPAKFEIASTEDWTSAIKFITDHALGYVNNTAEFALTKDVTIESLPIFKLKVSASSAKTLTLKKDYTISADNKEQFTFDKVNLAVANGATLTLKAQPTNIKTELINYGTLNVSADLTNVIKNFGTLNITADAAISGGLTNGQLENKQANPAIPAYVGTVNIAKGKALTINTAPLVNTNGTVAIAEDATLHINNIASTNEADGTIEVKGILKATTQALTNKGTIDNFGSLQAAITNTNGMFIIEKGSSAKAANSTITAGTVEVKDVAAFAAAQADLNAQGIIYNFASAKVTTKVTNAKEYKAADAAKVTDITLTSGEWTLAGAAGAEASKTVAAPDNADGLTLEGATLNVIVATLEKNISTSGTATSTVKTTAASTTITGDVVVGEGSTLVVEDKVTVNALASNSKAATINGTLDVMPGAKMYFENAAVAEGAKLNVKGDTKTNAAPGEFGVKTSFTNAGVVTSEAGSSDSKLAGKVSQPVNSGTGTFKGNATDFTFS